MTTLPQLEPLSGEDQDLITRIKSKVVPVLRHASPHGHVQYKYPPVSLVDVVWAETQIGARLPPLIREIFLQVGNGGFGPGTGITGLRNGHQLYRRSFVDHVLYTAKEIKAHLRQSIENAEQAGDVDPRVSEQDKRHYAHWQNFQVETLIWYCDWGCNIVTLVDFTKPELPIYCADGLDIRSDTEATLREWWHKWLDDLPSDH